MRRNPAGTTIALVALAAVAAVGYAAAKRKRKPSSSSQHPFTDASCTTLKGDAQVRSIIQNYGIPAYGEEMAADPLSQPQYPGDNAPEAQWDAYNDAMRVERDRVTNYIGAALDEMATGCLAAGMTPALERFIGLTACAIIFDLTQRALIDEDPADVIKACEDPVKVYHALKNLTDPMGPPPQGPPPQMPIPTPTPPIPQPLP